jgi:hypothetical protein
MTGEKKWIETEWSTEDLDGKSVKYRLLVGDGKLAVEGNGVIRASTRADGLKSIEISVQGREPERVTQVRLCVDESQIRGLKKLPAGSQFEYSLEDPSN